MNRYQSEIEDFENNFSQFKDKRIILYGIGRMTVTLLESNLDFNFVGLLDKNEENIGKQISGVTILSINEAVKKGDIIIINTSATYWKVIANRIKDVNLPKFYKSGLEVVYEKDDEYKKNEYWNISKKYVLGLIDNAQAVVFDFYDTLFMRKTYLPKDMFKYVDKKVKNELRINIDYEQVRTKAISQLGDNYTLDEIYKRIKEENDWSNELVETVKSIEIELEKEILSQRKEIVELLKYANEQNKEVFILSDMYLPRSFFYEVLVKNNIKIPTNNIYVSCEKKANKKNGSLWKMLISDYDAFSSILCIGDNKDSDYMMPLNISKKFNAVWIPSARDLLGLSSLFRVSAQVCSSEADAVMGLVMDKLFNDPFVLNNSMGEVQIDKPMELGYIMFGPILLEFYKWIEKRVIIDKTETLLFVARDGYFLLPCFEIYAKYRKMPVESMYLGVSRQLAMMASLETDDDLIEYIAAPYSGSVNEMILARFNNRIILNTSINSLEKLIYEIKEKTDLSISMWSYINEVKQNYRKYLKLVIKDLKKKVAVVDTGYFGNNQKYLNKILRSQYMGYYFNANLDESNDNNRIQNMFACFQSENDIKATESNIYNNALLIESVLTAPYGMIVEIDENQKFICKPKGKNQEAFQLKEEVIEGAKEFINDYLNIYGSQEFREDPLFCDELLGFYINNGLKIMGQLKDSFYYDNAFANNADNKMFD